MGGGGGWAGGGGLIGEETSGELGCVCVFGKYVGHHGGRGGTHHFPLHPLPLFLSLPPSFHLHPRAAGFRLAGGAKGQHGWLTVGLAS